MKALVISAMLLGVVVAFASYLNETTASVALAAVDSPNAVMGGFSAEELRAFAALNPIDTHAHVRRVDPTFNAMLNRFNIHLLDIILVDDRSPDEQDLQIEKRQALDFIGSSGRAVLCTSIDPYKLYEPGFQAMTIRMLNDDFDHGAVAVKIWKNIGMEIKDAGGNYVLPDNPAFAPIYKDISDHNKTLVAHIADPDSAWAAPNPASPDYSYYSENPEWYMYGKPHPASKKQILEARDHILEQNPNLRVVGAHLGSMEADLNQLAQHLDRYPNFAVDMAARMPYFALQPRANMTAFILKYQDRLIYATDLSFTDEDKLEGRMKFWELSYARDWRFLATTDTVEFEGAKGHGLALPKSVLRKIYHDNAVRWFPGILQASH
ncbi:MAG TPA: amidohydrolase family protein [Terracidiphilus sp.]|jgi:predicted TIM-barrel fold metal-dependent hydrolase|nr:amidohydrolase family protein [Terracidiphilus sp.]